ncbi:MAG: hypothetical protein AAF438_03540 [Pseudomonadota bacterium]
MPNKFGLLLLSLLLTACAKPPAEEIIREHMDGIQQAVEAKKSRDVLQFLKEDFLGNNHVDKLEVRRILVAQFLRHNNISVVFSSLDVEYRPELPYRATMTGLVAVTGAENLLPDDGRLLSIDGTWGLVEDEWRLETLNWQ